MALGCFNMNHHLPEAVLRDDLPLVGTFFLGFSFTFTSSLYTSTDLSGLDNEPFPYILSNIAPTLPLHLPLRASPDHTDFPSFLSLVAVPMKGLLRSGQALCVFSSEIHEFSLFFRFFKFPSSCC